MRIVVIGGTGMIGSRLVVALREAGHEALPASPSSGVNTITGVGLAEILSGAEVIVDVSNSPSVTEEAAFTFFNTSGHNLLAAATLAGIRHHVALSVIGADRLPNSGYFRAKMTQEKLILESGMPFTILRSPPFFEYIDGIIRAGAEGDILRLSPAFIQPIAADDVVLALRDVALGCPQNRVVEIVGPDTFRLNELAIQMLTAEEDPRTVVADKSALYFGAMLQDDSLSPRSIISTLKPVQ